jgi:hypothetical protein
MGWSSKSILTSSKFVLVPTLLLVIPFMEWLQGKKCSHQVCILVNDPRFDTNLLNLAFHSSTLISSNVFSEQIADPAHVPTQKQDTSTVDTLTAMLDADFCPSAMGRLCTHLQAEYFPCSQRYAILAQVEFFDAPSSYFVVARGLPLRDLLTSVRGVLPHRR